MGSKTAPFDSNQGRFAPEPRKQRPGFPRGACAAYHAPILFENILRNVLTMYSQPASILNMKKVLSLLLAFVFLQVESWALSGGPVFGSNSGGNPSIIGTYGGVMIPTLTQVNTAGGASPSGFQPAAIGLFSLSVPETGISAGVALVFVDGVAFIGQIAGIGDADKQSIQGIIAGTSSFQVVVVISPGVTQNFPIFAQGTFKADVVEGDAGAFTPAPPGSGNGTSSGSGSSTSTTTASTPAEIGSTNAARITGKAQIGTFFTTSGGEPNINVLVEYSMDGIKQNNIPSNVTQVTFSFSGGS
jgi:hypothetical protein